MEEWFGEPREELSDLIGLECGVAHKDFISAIACESDFNGLSGEFGQEVSGDDGGVSEGFVEELGNFWEDMEEFLRGEGLMVVFGLEVIGDVFSEEGFIE